jgi:hypothetical protein
LTTARQAELQTNGRPFAKRFASGLDLLLENGTEIRCGSRLVAREVHSECGLRHIGLPDGRPTATPKIATINFNVNEFRAFR